MTRLQYVQPPPDDGALILSASGLKSSFANDLSASSAVSTSISPDATASNSRLNASRFRLASVIIIMLMRLTITLVTQQHHAIASSIYQCHSIRNLSAKIFSRNAARSCHDAPDALSSPRAARNAIERSGAFMTDSCQSGITYFSLPRQLRSAPSAKPSSYLFLSTRISCPGKCECTRCCDIHITDIHAAVARPFISRRYARTLRHTML